MTIESVLSLLTSGLVLILVGIFLAPVIRDLTSRSERQESHTPLEDLVKNRQRWLQVQGLAGSSQIADWKARFPKDIALIEGFLTWGDPKLLAQVNEHRRAHSLGEALSMDELRDKLLCPPPKRGEITLIESLATPTLPPLPDLPTGEKNDQEDT